MDKLQAMATFAAIVEHGSLTAAARALGKSLPTVVRTLSLLEGTLEARLLTRTTRRIALTDDGRRYLQHCQRILADVDAAEAELSDRRNEAAGHLSVTAPVLFGQLHVVPGVSRFLLHHPQARVDLLLLDRVVNLIDEGIDVAVRIAPLADSSLIARPVGHLRRVLCASPEFLERAGSPARPGDLPRFECLRWRTQEGGNVWRFRDAPRAGNGRHELGRTLSVHPQGRFTSNHIAGALNACIAGLGIGSFLSYQVESFVASGELVVLLEAWELPPVPIALTHAHSRLMPTRVRTLMDFLSDDLQRRLATQALR